MNDDPKIQEFPLSEKKPECLKTPSGLSFGEITLDAVLEGKVKMEDLRVTAEALEWQAQIAEAAGRPQLAENFRRAAELTAVPDDLILRVYNALRPGRASESELLSLADELEKEFQASRCAKFIREAAEVYFGGKASQPSRQAEC
jgi:propanediol dehydratase small subunit